MRYTLMCKEREVLSFDIDVAAEELRDVRMLEAAAQAPFGLIECRQVERALLRFVSQRCISPTRLDLPVILEATGARSPIELAFRAGGFSLSDPYWYRSQKSGLTWAHGNYFDNDWDPAFGEAILRKDYDALRKASPATPDATCSGSSRKAWIRDEQGLRLLKGLVHEDGASVVAEATVSRMLARLLPEHEFVSYELVERDGASYSASRPFVRADEELVLAWQILPAMEGLPEREERSGSWEGGDYFGLELVQEFARALVRLGIASGDQIVAKLAIIMHLTFNRDMHPTNLGIVRNVDSGALRLAPLFDFDRAFGLAIHDRMKWACANPQAASLLIASLFSKLESTWDYSWYDRHALDGFEDEIARALRSCDTLPEGYAELAASLFRIQRTYVDRTVAKGRGA